MGNFVSHATQLHPLYSAKPAALDDPSHHQLLIGDLTTVQRFIKRFHKVQTGFGWAIDEATYLKLYTNDKERPSVSVAVLQESYKLWGSRHAANGSNSTAKIDILQIFAAYIILANNATYNAKITALFQLFDFDLNKAITKDEMTILLQSTIVGCAVLLDTISHIPSIAEMEVLTSKCFLAADSAEKKDGKISLDELLQWSHTDSDVVQLCCRCGTTDADKVRKQLKLQQAQKENATPDRKAALPSFVPVKLQSPQQKVRSTSLRSSSGGKPATMRPATLSVGSHNTTPSRSTLATPNTASTSRRSTQSSTPVASSDSPSVQHRATYSSIFGASPAAAAGVADKADWQQYIDQVLQIKQMFESLDEQGVGLVSFVSVKQFITQHRSRLSLIKDDQLPSFQLHSEITDKSATRKSVSANILSFSACLKAFLPLLKPSDINHLVSVTHYKPITKEQILQIKALYDELDVYCTGSVQLKDIAEALRSSTSLKLQESVMLALQNETSTREVTLHQLYAHLFQRTHSHQLVEILVIGQPTKTLTAEQRDELQVLFDLYDVDSNNYIEYSELKQSVLQSLPDAEALSLFDTLDLDADRRIDFKEFCRFYRTLWQIDATSKVQLQMHDAKTKSVAKEKVQHMVGVASGGKLTARVSDAT